MGMHLLGPRRAAAALAVAASLIAAAPASAALPAPGSFYNGSSANGGYMITTKHTIKTMQFFCKDLRYDVIPMIHIRRNGTFKYHGKGDRYAPGGERSGT